MKRILVLIFLCGVLAGMIQAADTLLPAAELAYQNGRYPEARAAYQTYLEQHPASSEALYYIGNTYFKQGEWGEALTYYSRAKRLAPRDKDCAFNMRLATAQLKQPVSFSPFSVEFAGVLTQWLSAEEAALLFFFPALVFLILLFNLVFHKRSAADFQWSLWVTGVLGGVTGVLLLLKCVGDVWPTYAIIIDRKVDIKAGPAANLTTQGYVYEGTKMRILKRDQHWSTVVLPNGVEGWVRSEAYWEL